MKRAARALVSGQVAGAALDGLAEEPPTDWKLSNCPTDRFRPTSAQPPGSAVGGRVGAEVARKIESPFPRTGNIL